MICFKNLTMHEITLYGDNGEVVFVLKPEGLARCSEEEELEEYVDNIPVMKKHYGRIIGLPESKEGEVFIVSRIVLDALKGSRGDCFSVNDTLRDELGRIIGFRSLAR